MADINIKRFVDINIQYNVPNAINSERDTVVLLSTEGSNSKAFTYSSLSEWNAGKNGESSMTETAKYVEVFFSNGGNKLKVVQGVQSGTLADSITALENEEIVVAYTGDYDDIKEVAKTREANADIYGINQKILLGRTNEADTDSVKNFAVKYSNVEGAEMSIAAYLSNIHIYGTDTVHDYMFTKENLTAEMNDDNTLNTVLTNNMNVDMYLADATRNLGGNLKDGTDLMNSFMLIVVQQTLTYRILNLLATKIKGSKGIAAIYTTIASELNRYVSNGYLTTDKIWQKGTKTVDYNGKTYTIIEDNTALVLGYHICILPYNSLSDKDKAERKCSPIYIFLADSYGIRAVTINGEVI